MNSNRSNSALRIARRFLIAGRVQGVGYRYFTRTRAVEEQLDGWVRNLADGRVEIEAEGHAESMRRFEAALRLGPRGGRVDEVIITELELSPARAGFSVR